MVSAFENFQRGGIGNYRRYRGTSKLLVSCINIYNTYESKLFSQGRIRFRSISTLILNPGLQGHVNGRADDGQEGPGAGELPLPPRRRYSMLLN